MYLQERDRKLQTIVGVFKEFLQGGRDVTRWASKVLFLVQQEEEAELVASHQQLGWVRDIRQAQGSGGTQGR